MLHFSRHSFYCRVLVALEEMDGGGASTDSAAFRVDEGLATEVFEFIYQQALPQTEDPYVRRLRIPHFPVLSRLLHLQLEDLSLYLFAFIVGCHGNVPLTIMEFEFVKAVEGMTLSSAPHQGNAYQPLFDALAVKVRKANEVLWTDKARLAIFYNFLYDFVLRYNDESCVDRRLLAIELWQLFFTEEVSLVAKPSPAAASSSYKHYAEFSDLGPWLDFVQSSAFRSVEGSEGHYVSADLWQQMFLFSRLDPSYDGYDPDGAWPNAVDDFMVHLQGHHGESDEERVPAAL